MKSTLNTRKLMISLFATLSCAFLAACNLPAEQATTPTINVTQAYQTVEARLTEASQRTPNSTGPAAPTDRGVPTATQPPATETPQSSQATLTPTTPATSAPPANSCDQVTPGIPIDVTIPDETEMQPGESFTKTWRLVNTGTCAWSTDYALVWFSGEQMGAPDSVPLMGEVAPGETVDLSVDMEAPQSTGTYISYWKLSNASGELFGIGPSGGSAFWVQIVVVPSSTVTVTATTPTITPTVTPTTGVEVSGTASLEPEDGLDLDTNTVNSGGEDIRYQVSGETHALLPQGSAALAVFGTAQPSANDCQSITLSGDALGLDGLEPGTYLCYRTNMALPGWARVSGLAADSGALELEIFTWALP